MIKIGILSVAHHHALSYAQALLDNPGATLTGIYDADAVRGAETAVRFGTTYYPTEQALLAEGLHGVIVASENVHHRRYVEAAAGAGVRAILCEKPLATTLTDAQAMIDVCAAAGVRLATAFPCRYSPAFRRLLEQVRGGAVGEVLAIRGTNRGKLPPEHWFVDKSLSGGGAVMDHSVHVADLNRLLSGREATALYAEIGNGFHGQEFDDTGFLSINYGDEVFATLDTSWSRPKTYPTWGDVTLQVVGTGGVLDADLFAQNITHYDDRAGSVTNSHWGSGTDAALIADFVRLASGETASDMATGEDGLHALSIAIAAYRSAEAGQPVAVTVTD